MNYHFMTKVLTAIFLSVTFISCDFQKKDTGEERIDKVCDKFMEAFSKGQLNEAVDLLKENSVLEREKIDTLRSTIIRQVNTIFPKYGKILSSEFITERKIKDFIVKRFYILKLEKYYLRFDFTLYKTPNGWAITSFNYNDELIELLY